MIMCSYPLCGTGHSIVEFCEINVCSVQAGRQLRQMGIMTIQLKYIKFET